jgi:hypothetical protein
MIGNGGNEDGDRSAIRDIFLKKRKLFLISSLLLLFVELSQLKIEKLNLLGNEIVIDNPIMLKIWLWGMFIYYGAMFFLLL